MCLGFDDRLANLVELLVWCVGQQAALEAFLYVDQHVPLILHVYLVVCYIAASQSQRNADTLSYCTSHLDVCCSRQGAK